MLSSKNPSVHLSRGQSIYHAWSEATYHAGSYQPRFRKGTRGVLSAVRCVQNHLLRETWLAKRYAK